MKKNLHNRTYRILSLIAAAALAACSCVQQDGPLAVRPAAQLRIEASFAPMGGDGILPTKAAQETAPASFRTWGYRWPSGGSMADPSWFADRTFTADGAFYTYDGTIDADVPSGYEALVWGVAPAGATGLAGLPAPGVSAVPGFTYTTPSDVALQRDIQAGASATLVAGASGTVQMTFSHVLAALAFHYSGDYVPAYTIRTISVSGVADEGTYAHGSGWSGVGGSATFTVAPEAMSGRTDYGGAIGTAAMTMMLIPQTLPAGSTLTVVLDRGGGDETVTASLAGLELRQGYVTYLQLGFPEEDAIDLSYRTYTGAASATRNTANCYIVGSTGVYDIPLVYGNGVKDGTANAAAYTRVASDYTAEFVNHLGNTLTSPYIEENAGCTAASADLLWQTSAGVVRSVRLVDGSPCRALRVHVDRMPETNAVAVLCVRDGGGNVMWSWTLWVTADDIHPEATVNADGVTYMLMNENLGAIWITSGRDAAAGDRYVCPFYQWGRKDPMCPAAAYNGGGNMALYDINGDRYTGWGTYGVYGDQDAGGTERSVANAIRKPEKFFLNTGFHNNWNMLPWFNNFWNAAETSSGNSANNQATAVKTIYDPCPPGWMLPAGRAWTGFSTQNIVGSWASGYFFKRNSGDAAGAWYPASGHRNHDNGGLSGVSRNGYYWSFAPNGQDSARNLHFNSGGVSPQYRNHRAGGFAVRPAQEP